MKRFFQSKITWSFLILIAIIGGGIVYVMNRPNVPTYTSTMVQKGTLLQTVEETGTVVSNHTISYSWETSGRVTNVYKDVGDVVQTGDVIAQLEQRSERSALEQAQAALAAAQAHLNKAQAGPSEQQKAQSYANVVKAQASLRQAEASSAEIHAHTQTAILQAQTKLQQATHDLRYLQEHDESERISDAYANVVDTLKSTVTTLRVALATADSILGIDNSLENDAFEEMLGVLNLQAKIDAESSYYQARRTLTHVEHPVITLTSLSAQSSIDSLYTQTKDAIHHMQILLHHMRILLDNTIAGNNLTNTHLSTLKSNIESSRVAVNTSGAALTAIGQALAATRHTVSTYHIAYTQAQTDLLAAQSDAIKKETTAQTAVDIAHAALAAAQAAHDDLLAPPRDVDIAALRADVARHQSIVFARMTDVQSLTLVALQDGVITARDIDVGEQARPHAPAVTVMSEALHIDVTISESDIAKVSLGDHAVVTLDAFGDDIVFDAEVIKIDPAQTEISGVIYYTTKLRFTDLPDTSGIKPGMTANVRITTNRVEHVLMIPQRAVLRQDGTHVVRVLTNPATAAYHTQPVTLGLRGDNGLVAIRSGLEEGQEVITFIKED